MKTVLSVDVAKNKSMIMLMNSDGEILIDTKEIKHNLEDFEKAKVVPTSDTQLYRQAGNSIVVNVLMELFKKLIFEDCINDKFI